MAQQLKRTPLWQVQAVVERQTEEAAAAVLEESLGIAPVSYAEPESNTVQLSVYLSATERPARPEWAALRDRLMQVTGRERRGVAPRLQLSRLVDRDWRHSWKHHFRPLSIGGRLLLRPSWSRRKARRGQVVVVLDPGLSFGTGQHATTRFCLQELVRCRGRDRSQSFLDLGTGSGILAITAAKLGYRPILALDNDPECVRVASRNARRNRVAVRMQIRSGDVARLSRRPARRHDFVCANLLASLLVEQADRITAQVTEGGWLTVAGILDREFPSVSQRLTALGGTLQRQRIEGEWHSASYRFPR
jgi:ribosomal protein L11 methyltransferase